MGRSNIVETLLASELLEGGRSPAVIELLANHGTMAQYGRGSIIPADPWPDFHILVEGSVHVVHSRVVVHTVAKTASTAVRFADWTVFDAARADPDLGVDLLRGAASLVAHLARTLVELTVERARDRLRLELVRKARRNMVDKQTGVIEPAPTHADLAAQVKSHREEVTREMSYLRGHSLIEKTGGRLLVRVKAVEDLYQRERNRCR